MEIRKRYYIVIVIIALVFIGLLCRYNLRAPKRNYCDFRVYYSTAERFIQRQNIYSRPDDSITPFKYSAMVAFVLSPLSFFSQKYASFIFFTLNFLSLIGIFVFSRRLIVKNNITFRESVFLHILTLICSCRFILQTLDSGQVSIIITFLTVMGLYFLEKKKDLLSSAFMAFSIMFKYTSFVFLPYLFFRNKKVVALILLFFILYCLFPAVYSGTATHISHLKSWFPSITGNSLDEGSWYDYKNQSLLSLVLRYCGAGSPYRVTTFSLPFDRCLVLAFIICLAIYSTVIFPVRKHEPSKLLDYSSLFICMALFNPNAWMHNFVISIFVYMFIFHYLFRTKWRDKVTLAIVVISFILISLPSEGIVGEALEDLFEESSSVTIGFLLLLLGLSRLKFRKVSFLEG